ncbi:conserved hypothethical protein (plasmid) [Ralstonia solanacearum CMR15]|nr:conserved hypothethical protein [Ralstonia solanacearum CMR15]
MAHALGDRSHEIAGRRLLLDGLFQSGQFPNGFGLRDFFFLAKLDGIQNAHIPPFSQQRKSVDR